MIISLHNFAYVMKKVFLRHARIFHNDKLNIVYTVAIELSMELELLWGNR